MGLFQGFSTLALLHQGLEDSLLQRLSCALKDGGIPSLFPVKKLPRPPPNVWQLKISPEHRSVESVTPSIFFCQVCKVH